MESSGKPIESSKLTPTSSSAPRSTKPNDMLKKLSVVPELLSQANEARPGCALCGLFNTCRTPFLGPWVPKGWRDSKRRALFIGEGPGEQEDEQGRPFVGPAGKLLRRMLQAAGFEDVDAAFHNAVRCRPPNNSTPSMSQVRACRPFVLRVIEVLRPTIIFALGTTAARSLLNSGDSTVTSLRGRQCYVVLGELSAPSWVTYHPAAILHGSSHLEAKIVEDLKRPYTNVLAYPTVAIPTARERIAIDTEWDKRGNLLCVSLANRCEAITLSSASQQAASTDEASGGVQST